MNIAFLGTGLFVAGIFGITSAGLHALVPLLLVVMLVDVVLLLMIIIYYYAKK